MSYRIKCNGCQAMSVNGIATHEHGCYNAMIYIDDKGKEHTKYSVWSLDVWGTPKDGFEVNDRSSIGYVYVPKDASDKDLLKILKQKDILNKLCRFKSFEIGDDGNNNIYINWNKTGMPLLTLEVE